MNKEMRDIKEFIRFIFPFIPYFILLFVLVVFIVHILMVVAQAEEEMDFFPVVNLIWDPAGDGQYMIAVQVTQDDGDIYQYQIGPQTRTYNRIDVDPRGFHEVKIFSGAG